MNLKIVLRQIRKSGFLSTVKFLSLMTGFAIGIVILIWVKKELSYDDFWENKNRIYRVALEQYQNGELQYRLATNYRGATDLLLAELPEVEGRVRLQRDKVTVFTPDAQIQDVNMFYADTCIFDILERKIIARESSGLFPDLRSILISSSFAIKIYGNENPIGRQLKLNEGWTFYVSAVFEDIPENSHIGFDILMTVPSLRFYMAHFNNLTGELEENPNFEHIEPGPYENRSWGRSSGYSYILIREGAKIEDIKLKAASLINPEKLPSSFKSAKLNMIFQPITSIHLHSALSEEIKTNGSVLKVYTMLLVAVIVLIISIVNFINLSVLDFYDQSVNSAIRMIHGANITSLLKFSFYKELLISLAAGLFSVMFGYYALKTIVPGSGPDWQTVILVIVILIMSSLLTLIIPLWHLRTHSMHDMMKKKIITGSGGKITREILITVQFAISIFLIAGTIVIFSQLRYIQRKDPGFVPDSIIFSYSPMTMNQRPDIQEKLLVFKDRVSQIPGIQSFCTSSSIPGKDFLMSSEKVSRVGDDPDKQTYFQILNVDRSYLDTYRLILFSGRNFTDTDQYPGNEVILNQLAARKLGYFDASEAIGEVIQVDGKSYSICGVVNDFHHLSLKHELTPVIIFKSLQWRYAVGYYSFRILPENIHSSIPLIAKAWSETYPGERFIYKFMEDNYREQYISEQNFGKSITTGSFLAILISCLGLLGFARYSAVKRIREIGIRKTFGASRYDILMLFNTEILRIVGIAAIFGLPLAWILVNKWLLNFAYRIEASLWMFITALALTALIAVSATFYVSWKASMVSPGESLKYE